MTHNDSATPADVAQDHDKAWFEKHTGRTAYVRLMVESEFDANPFKARMTRHGGDTPTWLGIGADMAASLQGTTDHARKHDLRLYTVVTQVVPGFRFRYPLTLPKSTRQQRRATTEAETWRLILHAVLRARNSVAEAGVK